MTFGDKINAANTVEELGAVDSELTAAISDYTRRRREGVKEGRMLNAFRDMLAMKLRLIKADLGEDEVATIIQPRGIQIESEYGSNS